MPHEHVTVTLDAETVERIEAELDGGETVAAWLQNAAHERLEAESSDRATDGDSDGPDTDEDRDGFDVHRGRSGDDSAPDDADDNEDRSSVEFVDDCFV